MSEQDNTRLPADLTLLALSLILLVPVECLCAEAAFETLGEISSWLYWAAAIGGNAAVLLVAVWSRFGAIALSLLLGLAIIPYQVALMTRHSQVQEEAARIVAYAYEVQASTGEFPADLEGYQYRRPRMKEFLQGYLVDPRLGGFQVIYRVGTESTSHWYSPRDGWSYYPD